MSAGDRVFEESLFAVPRCGYGEDPVMWWCACTAASVALGISHRKTVARATRLRVSMLTERPTRHQVARQLGAQSVQHFAQVDKGPSASRFWTKMGLTSGAQGLVNKLKRRRLTVHYHGSSPKMSQYQMMSSDELVPTPSSPSLSAASSSLPGSPRSPVRAASFP